MCRRQVVLPGGIGGTNQELNGTLSLFIKRPDDWSGQHLEGTYTGTNVFGVRVAESDRV